ncbi:hypothetical protein ACIA8K_38575 [Catenuloplanes sp. NPDC051500]
MGPPQRAAHEPVQVADRLHLWQNLATTVDMLTRRHRYAVFP